MADEDDIRRRDFVSPSINPQTGLPNVQRPPLFRREPIVIGSPETAREAKRIGTKYFPNAYSQVPKIQVGPTDDMMTKILNTKYKADPVILPILNLMGVTNMKSKN